MAKTGNKKAKKKVKASGKNKAILSLTPGGLKKAGATPFILPQAAQSANLANLALAVSAAHPSTHKPGSVIIAPGMGGTTIVCMFNPNTGNFDICHTVAGKVGIQV